MEEIKIFISGDFAPRLRVNDAIANGDYQCLYNDMLPIILSSDYSITNLESPLIENGTPIAKTGPNIKAPLKSIEALKFAGFDMVTLANNHAMDYGAEGLFSTIKVCVDNNIVHIGAGGNIEDARRVHYIELKGKKIAFINCCENEWSTTQGNAPGCNPLDEISLFYQIQEAKANADFQILIIHGGHETYELPSPRMKKLYRWFIDLGVDAVVGHHSHCYSGREVYKGKPIIYSIGNFIFDHPSWHDNFWTKACACIVHISKCNLNIEMIPFHQCDDQTGIHLYNELERSEFEKLDAAKTEIIVNDSILTSEFEKFLDKQNKMFEAFVEPFSNKVILALKKLHIVPALPRRSKRLLLMNLIRCEAHRDILFNHLKNTSK